jgi:hypothetical protein
MSIRNPALIPTDPPPKKLAEPTSRQATRALHELVARFCLGVLQFDPVFFALVLLTLAGVRT